MVFGESPNGASSKQGFLTRSTPANLVTVNPGWDKESQDGKGIPGWDKRPSDPGQSG